MDATGPSCKQDKTTLKTNLILYSKQNLLHESQAQVKEKLCRKFSCFILRKPTVVIFHPEKRVWAIKWHSRL